MSDATQKLLRHYQGQLLDPDSPTPLYHQLHTMLRDCIVGGVLNDGDRIPSEKELAEAFGVSRITARRALNELVLENLVDRHRGRGTFVNHRYHRDLVSAPLVGMLENLESMGRETRVKVLSLRFLRPAAKLAEEFQLGDSEQVCQIVRVRSHHSMPFAYYESWSVGFDRGLTKRMLEQRPRLELFKDFGVRITHIEQTLSAEAASPAAAEALGIMPGKPLLKLVRRSFNKRGQQVDHLDGVYNPDRFQYQMVLDIEAGASSKGQAR